MIRLVKVTYHINEYMEGSQGPYEKFVTIDDSVYPNFTEIECRVYDHFNEISDPYGTSYFINDVELVEYLI